MEAVKWGNILEDVIAKEFSKRSGIKVAKRNAILISNEYPFMMANIDRQVIGKNEGLEVKTASAYKNSEWEGDNVPDEYYIQCQHYMAVTGCDKWHIAVLVGGSNFVAKEIPRNQEFIDELIEREAEFWKCVETKTPPQIDASDDCGEFIEELHPEAVMLDEVELPTDSAAICDRYQYGKSLEANGKEIKTEAANALKMIMGDHAKAMSGEFKITWGNRKGKVGFNDKQFKLDHPALYLQYVKKGAPYRVFMVKKAGEKEKGEDE